MRVHRDTVAAHERPAATPTASGTTKPASSPRPTEPGKHRARKAADCPPRRQVHGRRLPGGLAWRLPRPPRDTAPATQLALGTRTGHRVRPPARAATARVLNRADALRRRSHTRLGGHADRYPSPPSMSADVPAGTSSAPTRARKLLSHHHKPAAALTAHPPRASRTIRACGLRSTARCRQSRAVVRWG